MKRFLITLAAGLFAVTARADDLTAEEQALVDKGATMEMFAPNEHSRHYITHLEATSHNGKVQKTENREPVLCFVFGMEDAAPARAEGQSMAEFKYSPSEAQQFLFAQGGTSITIASSPELTCRKDWKLSTQQGNGNEQRQSSLSSDYSR